MKTNLRTHNDICKTHNDQYNMSNIISGPGGPLNSVILVEPSPQARRQLFIQNSYSNIHTTNSPGHLRGYWWYAPKHNRKSARNTTDSSVPSITLRCASRNQIN